MLIDEVYLDAAPGERRPSISARISSPPIASPRSTVSAACAADGSSPEPELAERIWRLNELFGVSQPHADERLCCLALARLEEIDAGNAERIARNRDIAADFFARRDDIDWSPTRYGLTAFPRLAHGDVDALHALLTDKHDTSIVPGRWFEMPDHFRVGLGLPTEMLEQGLERLGAALDELA